MSSRGSTKQKIFRDPVHGYINVPTKMCEHFIDTALFQRLRFIEQTSMRVLYPSARHDRFAHSLGVYHLGKIAFKHLKQNAQNNSELDLSEILPDTWAKWEDAFHIACLLHDVGHAPFSHTFEDLYVVDETDSDLVDYLAKLTGIKDKTGLPPGSSHEKVGAILVLKHFKPIIEEHYPGVNTSLIARMITGWDHIDKKTTVLKVESCLIKLLNGTAIDVDKLDYIVRDTWTAGFDNTSVDTHRLLGALTIGSLGDSMVLAFRKSALSVLQTVVESRNYLHRWVYPHHKVKYNTWLLKKAVHSLPALFRLKKQKEQEFYDAVFSLKSLDQPIKLKASIFYLPADGDLIHYLKQKAAADRESYAYEWLSRDHRFKPLWKTYAEYCLHFPAISVESSEANKDFRQQVKALLKTWSEEQDIDPQYFLTIPVQPNTLVPRSASIFVAMPNKIVSYADLMRFAEGTKAKDPEFFYVYINAKIQERKQEILNFLKDRM